jgi:hypothetical protein
MVTGNAHIRTNAGVQAVRERLAPQLLAENLVSFRDRAQGHGKPRRHWSLAPETMFPDAHAQCRTGGYLGEKTLDDTAPQGPAMATFGRCQLLLRLKRSTAGPRLTA